MCEQCDEIQKRIDHYNQFLTQRFDPLTEERMKAAIADLERRKAELHQGRLANPAETERIGRYAEEADLYAAAAAEISRLRGLLDDGPQCQVVDQLFAKPGHSRIQPSMTSR